MYTIFWGEKKNQLRRPKLGTQDAGVSTCQRQGGPTKRHTASTDFLATTAFSQAVTLEIQPIDVPKKYWGALENVPSSELTYPTLGKGKSSSECHFWRIC